MLCRKNILTFACRSTCCLAFARITNTRTVNGLLQIDFDTNAQQ